MKTRTFALSVVLAACLIALAGSAVAATPLEASIYRGQLTDGGAPANGSYDLIFTLYAEPSGGTALDSLRENSREIRDGALELPLDFGMLGETDTRWVEVSVRPAGSSEMFETLTPRQAVNAAPTSPAAVAAGRAYDVAFTPGTLIGSASVLLGSINVPAGSYTAFVRMQVRTGATAPGNSFRLDCSLLPDFDFGVYRVGTETSAERYVTLQGAATLSSPGAIQVQCRDGNGHTDTLLSGKLTVIAVSGVN